MKILLENLIKPKKIYEQLGDRASQLKEILSKHAEAVDNQAVLSNRPELAIHIHTGNNESIFYLPLSHNESIYLQNLETTVETDHVVMTVPESTLASVIKQVRTSFSPYSVKITHEMIL